MRFLSTKNSLHHFRSWQCQHQPSYGIPVAMATELDRALSVMDSTVAVPPASMYLSLLKECRKQKSLPHAKLVQSNMALHQVDATDFLGNHLVLTLAGCGGVQEALLLFQRLHHRSVFSWTAIICELANSGQADEALRMYTCMQEDNVKPDCYTYVSLFKACGCTGNLSEGKRLHKEAQQKGFTDDCYVCSSLVSMYGKCGAVLESETVFCEQYDVDVVSWNAMLSAYIDCGEAVKVLQGYRQMNMIGLRVNQETICVALEACSVFAEEMIEFASDLDKAIVLELSLALLGEALKKGFMPNEFIATALSRVYGKCGDIKGAEYVFFWLSQHSVASWNALLKEYTQRGQGHKALVGFREMQNQGILPNEKTFVVAIQSTGCLLKPDHIEMVYKLNRETTLEIVRLLYDEVICKGFISNNIIGTALLTVYGDSGNIDDAEVVFNNLSRRDVVAWNAMLRVYVDQDKGLKALLLYRQMHEESIAFDEQTIVTAIQACGTFLSIKEDCNGISGASIKSILFDVLQALHADSKKMGYASDTCVGTALISAYKQHRAIADMEHVFNEILEPSTSSWNAIISAYADRDLGESALQIYTHMQKMNASQDDVTLASVLQSCSQVRCLDLCHNIYFDLICSGLELTTFLSCTLIRAYSANGALLDAEVVLNGLPQPTVRAWNAFIACHEETGVMLFKEMLATGTEPNQVTFSSLLSSCSNDGLLETAAGLLNVMESNKEVTPELKHYISLINLFGHAGLFRLVEEVLRRMPMQADESLWLCLARVCHSHGNMDLGKHIFDHAIHLRQARGVKWVSMSAMYADVDLLKSWSHKVYNATLSESG